MEEKYPACGTHKTEMDFSVYILVNEAGSFYVGQTNSLNRRLSQHNDAKRAGWTSSRGPWKVVHMETFSTRAQAMKKEKYLKSLKNKNRIGEYIAGWRKSTSRGS